MVSSPPRRGGLERGVAPNGKLLASGGAARETLGRKYKKEIVALSTSDCGPSAWPIRRGNRIRLPAMNLGRIYVPDSNPISSLVGHVGPINAIAFRRMAASSPLAADKSIGLWMRERQKYVLKAPGPSSVFARWNRAGRGSETRPPWFGT